MDQEPAKPKMGRPPKDERLKLVRVSTFVPKWLKDKLENDVRLGKATNMSVLIARIIAEHYEDF